MKNLRMYGGGSKTEKSQGRSEPVRFRPSMRSPSSGTDEQEVATVIKTDGSVLRKRSPSINNDTRGNDDSTR